MIRVGAHGVGLQVVEIGPIQLPSLSMARLLRWAEMRLYYVVIRTVTRGVMSWSERACGTAC